VTSQSRGRFERLSTKDSVATDVYSHVLNTRCIIICPAKIAFLRKKERNILGRLTFVTFFLKFSKISLMIVTRGENNFDIYFIKLKKLF